jgi:hypothetical protein
MGLRFKERKNEMGKFLIGLAGLIVGAIGGALFGGALIGGAATGIGVATGASAGICMTVQAAEEEGLLTAEEIDAVLSRAAADMAEMAGNDTPAEIVGARNDCASVMESLREAGQ